MSQDPSNTTAAATTTTMPKEGFQLIQEGSAKMLFPATGAVFYNPVQVQNRDLSILMISMFVERYIQRQLLKQKKKEFSKSIVEQRNETSMIMSDEGDNKGEDVNIKQTRKSTTNLNKEQLETLSKQLEDFETTADWSQLIPLHKDTYGITILDALAASGLRSIRYWKEIQGIHSITINDLDPAAIDLAKENIIFNELSSVLIHNDEPPTTTSSPPPGIRLQLGDATHEMYLSRRLPNLKAEHWTQTQTQQKNQYHVIDLDPYGSAAMFLDAAVQAVVDGGLLAITCTDMRALGGTSPEICYKRYASMPLPKANYLQELALRILLSTLATTAAKYSRSIKPILSVGMHFYVRVFVEIWDDKAAVNDLSLSIGTVYQSTQCPSFHIVPHGQKPKNKNIWQPARAPLFPVCAETGGQFKTAGPIWLGPLHDQGVVLDAIHRLEGNQGPQNLATHRNILGLLTVVSEELRDVPLFYTLSNICKTLSCPSPPIDLIRAALINGGYRVSSYHKEPEAIKTDAPNDILWDIFRCWHKRCQAIDGDGSTTESKELKKKRKAKESLSPSNMNDDSEEEEDFHPSARDKILSMEPKFLADFTLPEIMKQPKRRVPRFPTNPEPNWGPKPKAVGYKKIEP